MAGQPVKQGICKTDLLLLARHNVGDVGPRHALSARDCALDDCGGSRTGHLIQCRMNDQRRTADRMKAMLVSTDSRVVSGSKSRRLKQV